MTKASTKRRASKGRKGAVAPMGQSRRVKKGQGPKAKRAPPNKPGTTPFLFKCTGCGDRITRRK
jgi:hypothetical protein